MNRLISTHLMIHLFWVGVLSLTTLFQSARADEKTTAFFERSIRPVFLTHCTGCHGPDKQESGLRLDSRESMILGGNRGAALVPGNPNNSRILQAIEHRSDLKMPPDKKLSPRDITNLKRWIQLSAPWPPMDSDNHKISLASRHHWAFQKVQQPPVPDYSDNLWTRTPLDAFVLEKLNQTGLSPSPQADRRTLIRRVYYALTGLPPSEDTVQAFVDDPNPQAYDQLIDRLLASPQYGEHWARRWLDVARYSDTKGYVYAREERFWTHAWAYRDWVIGALNRDMPYNRFLLLQIAADQVIDCEPDDLAAMGFLTIGRRFLGVQHDIIDDRIDVVCRGTMGLTVGCARCHDHKYDPIPTADYYSLYGIFSSCAEKLVALDPSSEDEAFEKERRTRQDKLNEELKTKREESSQRARERLGDYLNAQMELDKYPPDGFDQIFEISDLLPSFVRRWETYLKSAAEHHDPVFVPWHAYARLNTDDFPTQAKQVHLELQKLAHGTVNSKVLKAFNEPPETFQIVIDTYSTLFRNLLNAPTTASLTTSEASQVSALPDSDTIALLQVLRGASSPCTIPDEPIVHIEDFFDTETCEALWKLQGSFDQWIIQSKIPSRYALTLVDRAKPNQAHVFNRGNPLSKGLAIPRQFLEILSGSDRQPFKKGSGRMELAKSIIDPDNPLTARVIVNRIWAHHFGEGIVSTPSDFGLRATAPSHPELLDWLTSQFIKTGWSIKQLHRMILLSASYRQSSARPIEREKETLAMKIDPENRLLWKQNERRMTFEEFRDSLLLVSGNLQSKMRGKPVDLFQDPWPKRRTLYGLVDRQFLPGTLRIFDFANPDLHIAKRSETTVPQQALYFLNHPFVVEQARHLAGLTSGQEDSKRVRALFQQVYQRNPSTEEGHDAIAFVQSVTDSRPSHVSLTAADWQYGYGSVDESRQQVLSFTPLPHFTGNAWQGGSELPDPKLGWVQLTNRGGHPGNDLKHAAIRRWTAPRDMTLSLRTRLVHEAAPGDGIRASIICSRSGLRKSITLHQQEVDVNDGPLTVQQGDTIDFVVDINQVLNNDQYLWKVTLNELSTEKSKITWNSENDFSGDSIAPLGPWEQLAHVLICTNEFLFVD